MKRFNDGGDEIIERSGREVSKSNMRSHEPKEGRSRCDKEREQYYCPSEL
jgi:hypothetical protein